MQQHVIRVKAQGRRLHFRIWVASAIGIALAYAAVLAWVGVISVGLRGEAARTASLSWVGWAIASVLVVAIWRWQHALHSRLSEAATAIQDRQLVASLFLIFGSGLLLRLIWIWCFPAQPASDGRTYLNLAQELLAGRPYASGGSLAYWPPGYPLFLLPWLSIANSVGTAVVCSNIFLYALGASGVASLSRQVGTGRVSTLAVALWCFWPNLIAMAGLPEKELLLAALMPWVLSMALRAAKASITTRAAAMALASGALLGAVNLVQPAMLLFPAVVIVAWLWASLDARKVVMMVVAFVLGMAVVIAPWSIRNLQVLGQFVVVSTNGGVGLYGANNERANGGYFEHWADVDFLQLPELAADKEGKRRAVAWIKANPGEFVALAYEKNLRFMGDDAVGVFQTIRRGQSVANPLLYAALKTTANLFWCAYWAGLLIAILVVRRRLPWVVAGSGILIPMSFLYSFSLHSIAESAGKYHVLMIGILCVLLPWLIRHHQPQVNDFRKGHG